MKYSLDHGLSEREVFLIGKIVVLWGSLEHEVFQQTRTFFGNGFESTLPKAMNNMQFSKVLELWKTHIVDTTEESRRAVLQKGHQCILDLYEFRNAIVHGMWNWSNGALEKITSIRIRKEEILTTPFTADDLAAFASMLETINFNIKYPGGIDEYQNAKSAEGGYMNRAMVALVTNSQGHDDFFRSMSLKNIKIPGSKISKLPMKNPPHPGTIVLHDCIEPLGLTITDTAAALGVSRFTLSQLVNGKRGISLEMSIRLSKAFGGSAESWLTHQAHYDLAQLHADKIKVKHLQPALA